VIVNVYCYWYHVWQTPIVDYGDHHLGIWLFPLNRWALVEPTPFPCTLLPHWTSHSPLLLGIVWQTHRTGGGWYCWLLFIVLLSHLLEATHTVYCVHSFVGDDILFLFYCYSDKLFSSILFYCFIDICYYSIIIICDIPVFYVVIPVVCCSLNPLFPITLPTRCYVLTLPCSRSCSPFPPWVRCCCILFVVQPI